MVAEGQLLWTPSPDWVAARNLTAFTRWVEQRTGRGFADYHQLWQWSTTDLDGFWSAVSDYFDVRYSAAPSAVLASRDMPGAQWFPGARLNFAEQVLRHQHGGGAALVHVAEGRAPHALSRDDFAAQVRRFARHLRARGIGPGDRVVAYVPHVPEAMVAMVATAAVGAVWASCSPDFGARGALDRFGQLAPSVLLAADGYRYGGREFDRRAEVTEIEDGLHRQHGLRETVHLPVLGRWGADDPTWADALAGPEVPAEQFACEQVPFDHPLWVLFSSGTTGLPKPIVHGHGGIVLEHLKLQGLQHDLRADDRALFFTTTSWMMWNFQVTMLLLGAVPVLYDGNPTYPEVDALWRAAQDTRARMVGASPAFVDLMRRAGIVPRERFDLSALEIVMPAGAPVAPATTAWFYENVKRDLWVATGSGGTDCCTGFVGPVSTLPVRAGEMQARSLGVAAEAWDERGRPLVGEVGELVITQPLPSMPIRLWGDDDGSRYRESYFDTYPGVWRHGDFFELNERGGCFVRGRSDAVLNRNGVRIGTAEIYRVVEDDPDVAAALAVNVDQPDGRAFMPLFVVPAAGVTGDERLAERLRAALRRECTPRHVPDRIVWVRAVPTTRTGKKMEVPVRRLLMGAAIEAVADTDALADPGAFADIVEYAAKSRGAS